ncbi:transmembrane protein, putative (macronuclear) [Tetrahymena thermophila SB210]|uniref:Transmembrane protein, putative n=1 Tax=Tetrahymena thermophila (strain SB210) TaxID=312017 RepID=Q23U73_TETTS|nr:transmembrane protein, putative [Tetrahymena thermophila SB210]EAS00071.1 transmembrane protein, putative [Tetrahymena thermophila SB210]|eukprot:XP_001020316.1 transmembrane protein, putative [Tetrahymena thermophila SB210]
MNYCQNGLISQDSNCSSTNICIDGYEWNYSDQKCKKQSICNESIIDKNLNLFQCQNCSLTTDLKQCQNSCFHYQYYSQSYGECMTYCGNGSVVKQEQPSCQSLFTCIDGLEQSKIDDKCVRQQTCSQKIYDASLNLFQCLNCTLVSDFKHCENKCDSNYFSAEYGCMAYCGNGIIASNKKSCQLSNLCIDGFQWNLQNNSCKKCDSLVVDKNLKLHQCPNCSIVSDTQYCQNQCKKNQYFSQKNNNCFQQCENGRIQTETKDCSESPIICIDGFEWNKNDNKCVQCDQSIFDSKFNIYSCSNCSLASDVKDCQNNCQMSEYFSQFKNQCMKYCWNGIISNLNEDCSLSQLCTDGFYWDLTTQKCEKSCDQKVFDSNLQIHQCQNCSFASVIDYCHNCSSLEYYSAELNMCKYYCGSGIIAPDKEGCQFSNYCIDGYRWSKQDNQCRKCEGDTLDKNLNLFVCSNCSFTSDIQACNRCQSTYYYSQQHSQCVTLCENGLILLDYEYRCSSAKACVDGFQLNNSSNKCEKCNQTLIDANFNLHQCPSCFFVTNIEFCQKKCLNSQYFSQQYGCMTYCGNGFIALDQSSCSKTNVCIDGFQFNESDKKCEKCNQSIFDNSLNIHRCENCSLVTDIKFCSNNCTVDQFYLKEQSKCMNYCENGLIAEDISSCFSNLFCLDGSQWNFITKKCETNLQTKCPSGNLPDSYVKVCSNCSFVTDTQFCKNSCYLSNNSYFFEQKNQCWYYCGNGLISQDKSECKTSEICVDGFQWDFQTKKCEKNYNCPSILQDAYVKLCSNCSLVTDTNFCQNKSFDSFKKVSMYYDQQQNKYMNYCGKGQITSIQSSCNVQTTNTCIDGFQWNSQNQQCETNQQTLCASYSLSDSYVKICSNCSIVSDTDFCQNNCSASKDYFYYYSQKLDACMYYCGNGLIANTKSNCKSITTCIDGLVWNFLTNKCESSLKQNCPHDSLPDDYVKVCNNCSFVTDTQFCQNECLASQKSYYYHQQSNQCMYYCKNGLIANDYSLCQFSNTCVEGYQWNNQSRKCEKKQICEEKIFDSSLGIYQCPNCSLVVNTQFCQNDCNHSQFYSQANCMIHCGKGLIAKDQKSCKLSNLCIDGFILTEEGKCNPYGAFINQKIDQNFLIMNILIPLLFIFVIIIFVIWVVKKVKGVVKAQAGHSEIIKKQQQEAQKYMIAHQEEIEALKQKLQKIQSVEINQNEIILSMNNQKEDLEEQSLSKQTVNMIENFKELQQDQYSQQQFQENPAFDNQHSQ